MNRVKLTIKNDCGQTLCKIGTSISEPACKEYSDAELEGMLRELANMIEALPVTDYEKCVYPFLD